MRYGRGIRTAALLGVLMSAAGCSDGDDGASGSSAPPTVSTATGTGIGTETPSSSPSPPQSPYSDNDTVLMAKGDCYEPVTDAAPGLTAETACDDPDAIGKVIKRAKEKTTQDTYIECPDATDDVLGISDTSGPELAGLREYVPYATGTGYACVRNLKAPHPGDPGGGGMKIRVGDCLWTSGPTDQYRELPCEGDTLPDLKIVGHPDWDDNCPRPDDIQLTQKSFPYITGLGGPTYCARRLTDL